MNNTFTSALASLGAVATVIASTHPTTVWGWLFAVVSALSATHSMISSAGNKP